MRSSKKFLIIPVTKTPALLFPYREGINLSVKLLMGCFCNYFFSVQMKTGGFVIWRKKDTLVIYRGVDYHSKRSSKGHVALYGGLTSDTQQPSLGSAHIHPPEHNGHAREEKVRGETGGKAVIWMDVGECSAPVNGSLYERETDRLLDGLGPRFEDWWMRKPLPVDADLLPEVIPGFNPPLRMCPLNERSKITDDELTYLRKLAHPLPTHFVLGILLPIKLISRVLVQNKLLSKYKLQSLHRCFL